MNTGKTRTKRYSPKLTFKTTRRAKKLTAKQVADYFEVTETTIRNIEAGITSVTEEFMIKSSLLFNVDILDLFPESPICKRIKEQLK